MRLLNNYLVLEGAHVSRNAENGRVVSLCDARRRTHYQRSRRARSDKSSLASEPFGQVLAGLVKQFIQVYRLLGGQRDRGLHFVRHDRGGQHSVSAGRVDKRSDAEFLVVIHSLHRRLLFPCNERGTAA